MSCLPTRIRCDGIGPMSYAGETAVSAAAPAMAASRNLIRLWDVAVRLADRGRAIEMRARQLAGFVISRT
ncbi:hypothetical protein NJB18091_07870 [Mycobacterium marinum]|nr:hypothetical protein NJB18091_07870 [Mycobacterium marinum]